MGKYRPIACTIPWIYRRFYGFPINFIEKHIVSSLMHYHLRLYTSYLLLLLSLYYRLNKWAHNKIFGLCSHRRKCSHMWSFRHKYLVLSIHTHTPSFTALYHYSFVFLSLSTSATPAAAEITRTLPLTQRNVPFTQRNEAPTSSFLIIMIEPFNFQARQVF